MNKEISAAEAAILRDNNKDAVFLDVREDSELTICRIEGALHIPMGFYIGQQYDSLPRDGIIVVFCHHGMRSANVQRHLESKGFENIINMTGGIHAWSQQVDSEVPTY